MRTIDGAQLPWRLPFRGVGRHEAQALQHELSPDVLAAIVVQMNGEVPSLSAGIRVAPVITGELQLPSVRWPIETLL
jgi:hypothetical protein